MNHSGKLAATGPKRGRRDSCEPDEPPEDFEILASYHTHGDDTQEADTEVPSLEDLAGDIEEGIDGYIATPGGRLWLNDARLRQTVPAFPGMPRLPAGPRIYAPQSAATRR